MTCVGTCPHLRVQDAPDLLSPGTVIVLPLTIHRRFPFWKCKKNDWVTFSALSPSCWRQDTRCYWIHLWQSYSWISILYPRNQRWFLLSCSKRGGIWQLSGHIHYCDEVGGLESSQVSKSPQVILTLRPAQSWAENRRKSRGETENRECQGLFKI